MNLLKKAMLYAAVPMVMGSCSLTLATSNSGQYNRQYESELLLKIKDRNDLSNLSNLEMMDYWDIKFRNSVYSSNLGRDSDGDGIINADDIWKYRYGPFVDSNGNGIVDMFDWQIAGFNNPYISNYPYTINNRWIGLDLNPFWIREYGRRYNNYFHIHKKHRHQDKRYWNMHTIRDNKRRVIYNRSKRRRNPNNRSTKIKRTIPTTRKSVRGFNTRIIQNKKHTKSTMKKLPIKRTTIKRTQTRKSISIKKIMPKRQSMSRRN